MMVFVWLATLLPLVAGPGPRLELVPHLETIARLAQPSPRKRVVWSCVGGPDEWRGTVLTWVLSREGEGTKLRFKHGKWRSTKGDFARCNSTWGALMHRLKSYAEGKGHESHFT